MNTLTVYVYPVAKASVQKRHLTPVLTATKESGRYEVKETGNIKPYFRAEGNTSIKFMIDRNTGKYRTGLETIITNPLHKNEAQEVKATYKLNSLTWDKEGLLDTIISKDKIDLQTYYEILDGQDPGTYHNTPQNDMLAFVTGAQRETKPKSYIEKEEFVLYTQGSNVFTTETQRGRLAIQCIKNQPSIALTKEAINSSTHDWYIGRENEAEHDKAKMNQIINDAIFELETFRRKFPMFDMYRLGVVLEDYQTKIHLVKGDINDTVILDRLNGHIKNKSKWQEENINSLLDRIKEFNEQPELFQVRYMTEQGLNTKVLSRRDGKFYWNSQVNGNKTWHEWKNQETFMNQMLEESKTSLDKGNYFVEFEEELKAKGIKTR